MFFLLAKLECKNAVILMWHDVICHVSDTPIRGKAPSLPVNHRHKLGVEGSCQILIYIHFNSFMINIQHQEAFSVFGTCVTLGEV